MKEKKIVLDGLIDLNILPKDGKVSLQSIQHLSDLAYKNGVVGYSFSQIKPLIDSELKLTLLESISKKIDDTTLLMTISGVDENNNLTEIASLIDKAHAIFIKSDMNQNLMRRVFEYAKMKNKPIICKIRNRELNSDGVVNDTENGFNLGLPTRHMLGERIGVAIVKEMAKYFNVPTLLQGLTEKEALKSAIDGKKEGIPLLIEISIHHLMFDDTIYKDFNNYSKIEPPFQSEEGKEYLIQILKNGEIDMLTSLHHQVSESEKSGSFKDSQYGVIGLDGILPLYYSTLVQSGYISLQQLEHLISKNQKKFLGIKNNKKVILNLNKETKIENQQSLYNGRTFIGKVERV